MCNCNQQYKLIQELESELNDEFNLSLNQVKYITNQISDQLI